MEFVDFGSAFITWGLFDEPAVDFSGGLIDACAWFVGRQVNGTSLSRWEV